MGKNPPTAAAVPVRGYWVGATVQPRKLFCCRARARLFAPCRLETQSQHGYAEEGRWHEPSSGARLFVFAVFAVFTVDMAMVQLFFSSRADVLDGYVEMQGLTGQGMIPIEGNLIVADLCQRYDLPLSIL